MDLKVIRDDLQYSAMLDESKKLAAVDPAVGTPAFERLELIAVLLQRYEQDRFLIDAPDPVDAILFRMDALGLQQKDLADMLGSKSRASEILARKRHLTIEHMRILRDKLKLPADVLLGIEKLDTQEEIPDLEWEKFPANEMIRRGWIENINRRDKSAVEQAIKGFFSQVRATPSPVFLRRSLVGQYDNKDSYSLYAWIARVLIKAREVKRIAAKYVQGTITDEFLKQLGKLSYSGENGLLLAQEFLAMKGITLVIEPHLQGTRLDGAALLDEDGSPVIGLTLRYDYIDSFWFTLLHECAHIQRHLSQQNQAFIDNLDIQDADRIEDEANAVAEEALIPRAIWRRSDAYRIKTYEAVYELANELRIHPAIIAGRIRKETGNFRLLSKLKPGGVKAQFLTEGEFQ